MMKILSQGRYGSADVLLREKEGKLVAIKDYSRRGVLFRTVGRFLINNEMRAYQRLKGLPWVSKFYGRSSPYALMMEYIPGKRLCDFSPGQLPADFFSQLEEAISHIHKRGVAIRDMNTHNIIVTSDFKPHLIDFSTCIMEKNPLFRRARQRDLISLAQFKSCFVPELLSQKEKEILTKRAFENKAREFLEDKVRNIVIRLLKGRGQTILLKVFYHSPDDTLAMVAEKLKKEGFFIEEIGERFLLTGWKVMDWRFWWEITPLILGGSKLRVRFGVRTAPVDLTRSRLFLIPEVEFSIGGSRWQSLHLTKRRLKAILKLCWPSSVIHRACS